MTEIIEYFTMGGYGRFVWPCYLVVGTGLLGIWFQSKKSLEKRKEQISALEVKLKEAKSRGTEYGA